nr:YdcF family protein [Moraxellaceae bacterium]
MSSTLKIFRLLLLIIGIVLIIDCSVLLFLFKVNFGTVVPLIIGLIFVIHAIFWQNIQNFIGEKPSLTWAWYGCWAVFTLWLITFIIFVATLLQQINNQP